MLYYEWNGINISCLQNIAISAVQNTIFKVWNKIVSIVSIVSKYEATNVSLTGKSTRRC